MPAFWHTPRRPMITHTRDSHQIPSQNNTKSKLQILKKCQNPNFEILQETLLLYTLWSCLIKCKNMKWIHPKLWALQSGHGMRDGRTDGWMDRRTDRRSETNIPPAQLHCAGVEVVQGYNKVVWLTLLSQNLSSISIGLLFYCSQTIS